jgi:hypothetical protein
MDELTRTDHMTAVNIQSVMQHGIDLLWSKVVLPHNDPRREALPNDAM